MPSAHSPDSNFPSGVTTPLQVESGQRAKVRPYNGVYMAQEMIEHQTELISITDSALTQLRDLLQKQGRPEMGLRVFVQPGGCSGMSYGMGFEDRPEEGDAVSEVAGVRLFVDSVSAQYIKGAEIDFVDSLMGGGFTVHNPNAVSSCSCGSSFDTGGDAGTARGCSH
jgi:iron-sulfur cluster assembly protein